ncbi:serine protease Hayan-like isoform X1 [Homarus americanus]|uniref:serine protease Hayan-like isoform X1 n=1 Tax=Homarus americanus TaxID=6706 RepID=UPI001C445206|nr:serine protease Hayan-like isoform X1 [Homarus americanus]
MTRINKKLWAALMVTGVWATQTQAHFGSCEDHSPDCLQWASNALCDTDPGFMLQNCPVSCNACLDPDCVDKRASCNLGLASGACQTHRDFMMANCRHTCGGCRIGDPRRSTAPQALPLVDPSRPLSRIQTIVDPDFECGRGYPSTTTTTKLNYGGSDVNLDPTRIIFPDEAERLREEAALSRTMNRDKSTMMMLPGSTHMMTPETNGNFTVMDALCGATPISDRFLLTAAHCVFDPDFPIQTVRLGELDFSSQNEKNSRPVDYDIKQIIVHPNFDPDSFNRYNDIALLETVDKIIFNELVFPYCVSDKRPTPNSTVTGSGFGLINQTHQSAVLQEADLRILDSAECESIYRREHHEPQLRVVYPDLLQGRDIMCANHPERSACEGDSGGPLFLDEADGRRFVVGIVSSGVACRGAGASILPGFFISVADHVNFINSVLYAT